MSKFKNRLLLITIISFGFLFGAINVDAQSLNLTYPGQSAEDLRTGSVKFFEEPGGSQALSFTPCDLTPFNGAPFDLGSCAAELFNFLLLRTAALFLWATGWFFNFTLAYSLNLGDFLTKIPIVDIGWKIFRDVANLCFIFILLYIAVNTILQTKSADSKRMLISVIIVAVLLNFSLFFTKVVIDTSNILALQFYEKMGGEGFNSFDRAVSNESTDRGISQTFLKALRLEGIYKAGGEVRDGKTITAAPPTTRNVLAISIGGALFIMITAFVFLAAALLFIVRTITLVFLMILAPLAFLCIILPQTQQYWKKWTSTLISQSFFAPIYMIMIYLVLTMIQGKYGGNVTKGFENVDGANFAEFLTGNGSSVGVVFTFVILIALMLGSLLVAKSMGANGGDFARDMAGKATFGVGSWLGRQSAGRLGQILAKTDAVGKMRNATGRSAYQRLFAAGIDKTASGSMDFRGSKLGEALASGVGGLGKVGGEGGFKKMQDEDKKRKAESQKIDVMAKYRADIDSALAYKKANPFATDADSKIQSELYKLSDSQFGELGGSYHKNPDVIRNAKSSQVNLITDDKYEKLSASDKNNIFSSRRAGIKHAAQDIENDGSTDVKVTTNGAEDAIKRFNSLSEDARNKIENDKSHPTWTNAINEIKSGNVANAQREINNLTTDERKAFTAVIKRGSVKAELGKLNNKEKANLGVDYLTDPKNSEVLRNLDGETLKAIESDLPPAEFDKIKIARRNMVVKDLISGKQDDAKEILKGAKASEIKSIIAAGKAINSDFIRARSATLSGGANITLAKLITAGQLRELENEGMDKDEMKSLGDQIRLSSGNALNYVKNGGKGYQTWS